MDCLLKYNAIDKPRKTAFYLKSQNAPAVRGFQACQLQWLHRLEGVLGRPTRFLRQQLYQRLFPNQIDQSRKHQNFPVCLLPC